MTPTQYSYLRTGIKAFTAAIAVIAPGLLAVQELPADVATFEANQAVIVGGIAIAAIRALMNLWKHRDTDGNPLQSLAQKLNEQ